MGFHPSYVQTVIDDEIASAMLRMLRGVRVDKETGRFGLWI